MKRLPHLRFAGVSLDSSAAGSQPPLLFNKDENESNVTLRWKKSYCANRCFVFAEAYSDRDKSNWFSFFFLFGFRAVGLKHFGTEDRV